MTMLCLLLHGLNVYVNHSFKAKMILHLKAPQTCIVQQVLSACEAPPQQVFLRTGAKCLVDGSQVLLQTVPLNLGDPTCIS